MSCRCGYGDGVDSTRVLECESQTQIVSVLASILLCQCIQASQVVFAMILLGP